MMKLKVGQKIFSPTHGLLPIEEIRGKGKDREVKISILGVEYWIPIKRIW